jgi:hypothetical protein
VPGHRAERERVAPRVARGSLSCLLSGFQPAAAAGRARLVAWLARATTLPCLLPCRPACRLACWHDFMMTGSLLTRALAC